MMLVLLCRTARFTDFGMGRWRRLEERCPTTTMSVVVAATATAGAAVDDDGDFKLVVFKIGNADFDLATCACVRSR